MVKFTRTSLRCPCPACRTNPAAMLASEKLVALLNSMQAHIGDAAELQVSSSVRCPAHNQAVGGQPDSQHLMGLAADLVTAGDSQLTYLLVDAAMVYGVAFIEVAPRHVHIDLRPGDRLHLIVGAG